MYNRRVELVEEAQEKLFEVIELLEEACEGDSEAEAYIVDHLKIYASANHGFCSGDLNLDELKERYSSEEDEEEEDEEEE